MKQKQNNNPFESSTTIASQLINATGSSVTPKTVRNKMKNAVFQACTPCRKPFFSHVN